MIEKVMNASLPRTGFSYVRTVSCAYLEQILRTDSKLSIPNKDFTYGQ